LPFDPFLVAILLAVACAWWAPTVGADGGSLGLSHWVSAGIALVFFLHGAQLSREALHGGARNWRLHLMVQLSTFVFFPVVGAAAYFGLERWLPVEVRLAFFYLCALPSTISSSVAMTALARGNVPAAVFNAALSGILGMVITPALMAFVTAHAVAGRPLGESIVEIFESLLLPFIIGQLLRPLIGGLLARHRTVVNVLDRAVIVLIVYTAFCNSIVQGVWAGGNDVVVVSSVVLALVLVAAAFTFTTVTARSLRFTRADEVVAVFCGSKKSLASGAPMAKILMGNAPELGVIMLPLIVYHQTQLLVAAVLARRYALAATKD